MIQSNSVQGLGPGKSRASLKLKLKQPKVLPPILRNNNSLSQLEEMADHFDQSRHMDDDAEFNPYGAAAERSIISNHSVEGGFKGRSVLGMHERNPEFAVRSQMVTKVKSLGLSASRSQPKSRPLIVSKSYATAKKEGPQHYSYLKTKYFQQPGQNMNLKSQKVLDSAAVVVSNFDPSVYRNQITELSIENSEMRNKIEKLNFDKYLLAETVNQ